VTALHPAETHLVERRARVTGTRVALVYSWDADPDQPWETICYGPDDDHPHGGVASHETRALAERFLSHPDEWCEYCMGNLS
jgi:hypothetical protein